MRRFWTGLLVASLVAGAPITALGGQATAKVARTIDINATDDMKFSVTTITAKPGETLRVRLHVVGKMPKVAMSHNFVLFKAGTTEKQLADFAAAGMAKGAVTYVPDTMKDLVLASTTMAGAGEVVEVTFTVPKTAGTYPYICSFTGHYLVGMKGTLVAK
jgi:azurin